MYRLKPNCVGRGIKEYTRPDNNSRFYCCFSRFFFNRAPPAEVKDNPCDKRIRQKGFLWSRPFAPGMADLSVHFCVRAYACMCACVCVVCVYGCVCVCMSVCVFDVLCQRVGSMLLLLFLRGKNHTHTLTH